MSMKTYTTKQGDMWDMIAYRLYGNTEQLGNILRYNPEHIDTFVFPAGVTLNIPDPIRNVSSAMPPWKQDEEEQE